MQIYCCLLFPQKFIWYLDFIYCQRFGVLVMSILVSSRLESTRIVVGYKLQAPASNTVRHILMQDQSPFLT